MQARVPYLIQRCMIDNPLPKKDVRFGKAIRHDYMGSSEFEWNAVPNAFVYKNLSDYKLSKVDVFEVVDGEEKQLRLFHCFNDEELAKYVAILKDLQQNQINLKEASGFDVDITTKERAKKYYAKVDMWTDLDNNVIFTYHKMAANRIADWCQASKKYFGL